MHSSKHYQVEKGGSRTDHLDDAVAVASSAGRFAVADGTTEGGFTGLWARLLVKSFTESPADPTEDWEAWFPAAQNAWLSELQDVEIPWYGQEHFEMGAFATFLGMTLNGEGNDWRAVAIGDSCLFQTRENSLVLAFPLTKSQEFGIAPELVGSRSPLDDVLRNRRVERTGKGAPGDRLWMMSDALAQWCLKQCEADENPWEELAEFLSASSTKLQFMDWIEYARKKRKLRNDDVTMLVVEI